MSEKRIKWLISLSACLIVTLIVANLSALKIWNLGGIPVDAGIIMFPLSYIAGDLLVEFYGEKMADFVAFVAAIFGVITLTVLNLARFLPDYPGADNSGFDAAASMAGQIFLASIISFLLGQMANNRMFEIVRNHGKFGDIIELSPPRKIADLRFFAAFFKRAIASSSAAHAVDAIIFEVIAFYGKLPLTEFLTQIGFAYLAGLGLEILLFPVTYALVYAGHKE